MKASIISCALLAVMLVQCAAQDLLDRLDQKLTLNAFEDKARARLSGLVDVEGYSFEQPPPGLINAGGHSLFNPRLTLFVDAQLGPKVYFFVQARVDRGFDPGDGTIEARADEYALRFTPWDDGRFNLQMGKFATVLGTWQQRHLSWENPFVTAPLPYENLTSVSDAQAPATVREMLSRPASERYESNPIIWGPSYATGASAAGHLDIFEYAVEIKNASLSSRPDSWDAVDSGFAHPTLSTRLGFRPNEMWNFGVSASEGAYFQKEAEPTLPSGHGIGSFREYVVGQDASFAWHHLQLWAECFETRFDVPYVGKADSLAYYFESKYKFTPRFFGALRWNQQYFGNVPDIGGGNIRWGYNIWRSDAALGYRFTAHTQVKIQYSIQHEDFAARNTSHLIAAQFTLKF